jgi:hypothetical protein
MPLVNVRLIEGVFTLVCSPFLGPLEMRVNQHMAIRYPFAFGGGWPCNPRSHSSLNSLGVL